MGDNRQISGSPDSLRINVEQEYEDRYWTKELDVSPQQLREAVQAAGTSADAVKTHLKRTAKRARNGPQ